VSNLPPPPKPTYGPASVHDADEFLAPSPVPGPVFLRPTLPAVSIVALALVVVGAVLANLAIRSDLATVSSGLSTIVIAAAVTRVQPDRTRLASVLLVAAVVFSIWLSLRASSWLTSLNSLAVAACLLGAAATAHPLRLALSTHTVSVLSHRLFFGRFFGSVVAKAFGPLDTLRSRRFIPVLRGLAIAFLPVIILGALLAEADAVFAQAFNIDMDPSSFFEHFFLTLFTFACIVGLLAVTSESADESFRERRFLGATEALVLLLSIATLYAAFAVVQLVSAMGGADIILEQQGLTSAEYARSGFFQLLWVAGLTLGLLGVVRMIVVERTGGVDNAIRASGALVALLTLIIVAAAIVRLGFYTDSFGQTTLRWYSNAFAWMLGALFLVVAAGHLRQLEARLPIAALAIVALSLFAVNVLNPEARVAHHNLNRSGELVPLDASYLTLLSADAWPELLDHSDRLADAQTFTPEAIDRRCRLAAEHAGYSIFGFNLARHRLDCNQLS